MDEYSSEGEINSNSDELDDEDNKKYSDEDFNFDEDLSHNEKLIPQDVGGGRFMP